MPSRILVALIAVGALAGCAQTRQSDRADLLDRPVDCTKADRDIAALEAAIPGSGERVAAGVQLLVPVARIAGSALGKIGEKEEVASGRTEDALRARIAKIEAACSGSRASHAVAAGWR